MSDRLFDVSGRVAVVTGGMGQLGRVYVDGLAERGMRVAVFDVAGGELPDGARAFTVDVTDRAALEEATAELVADWGAPHLLVNNAALDSPPDAPAEEVGPFESYPEESFDTVMDVNVKGTFLCCQVVGGEMARAGRGSIVNVSSVYGLLSPVQVGPFALPNRVVMAPLTRNRAGAGNVPGPMNATYYEQRSGAGLIVSEATQVDPTGSISSLPAAAPGSTWSRWRGSSGGRRCWPSIPIGRASATPSASRWRWD